MNTQLSNSKRKTNRGSSPYTLIAYILNKHT